MSSMPMRIIVAFSSLFAISGGVNAAEEASELVKRIKPAVVTILAYDTEAAADPVRSGTGFFVGRDRCITNWHVVQGAKKLEFRDSAGVLHKIATVIGSSERDDLAVLEPESKFIPESVLEISESEPDVGARIFVLGSPLGLEYSLSDGLVSSAREIDTRRVLQITAAISPGSSGSPVVDRNGRVVGVATFYIEGGQALNFAIPIAAAASWVKFPLRPINDRTNQGAVAASTRPTTNPTRTPERIVFVVDTSGSMIEVREKAERAIIRDIESLDPQDKFIILLASGEERKPYPPTLCDATPARKTMGLEFVRSIELGGETAPLKALRTAFAVNPSRIVIYSDGFDQLTGTPEQLLKELNGMNKATRIKIDVRMLESGRRNRTLRFLMLRIADENGGSFAEE